MQRETTRLYSGLQVYQLNHSNVISAPNQNLPRGFPFEGSTIVQGICLPLPGPTSNSSARWLILRIKRCSPPFPFDRLMIDRGNNCDAAESESPSKRSRAEAAPQTSFGLLKRGALS
jgi:hypothetical protein